MLCASRHLRHTVPDCPIGGSEYDEHYGIHSKSLRNMFEMTSSCHSDLPDDVTTVHNAALEHTQSTSHLEPTTKLMSNQDPLSTPLQFARGVGPDRAILLNRMGLQTVEELLLFVPRDVQDLTQVSLPWKLKPDELQTVYGVITAVDVRPLGSRKTMQSIVVDCEGHFARGVWFNQHWVPKRYVPGQWVLLSGKPKKRAGRWEFTHPRVQVMETSTDAPIGSVLPVYPLTEGLKMHEIRWLTKNAVEDYAELLPDPLPPTLLNRIQLPSRSQAVRQLHCPETAEQFYEGQKRVIFDDLFEFQIGVALRRRFWNQAAAAPKIETTAKIDARIRRLFPFRLTAGQDTTVREVAADMKSSCPMHRLVQADVGAGKTAVAIYAMLSAVANGQQAVLMAPTEVLAQQHWQTIDELLEQSRVNRVLLTGQAKAGERREILSQIQSGELQLVIGTQAVIQKDVEFASLGLAVIDEQHKFGVRQRAAFASDSNQPHVLVMTATPIPRSLCLTQFGDLDISVIRDQPAGRQQIVTHRVTGEGIERRAWKFIREQLGTGRQAYVVCPRVHADETDVDGLAAAEQIYEDLRSGELAEHRVGLAHGQMDRRVRHEVMEQFRNHQLDVLVATTVVEVGIDVPNASIMVIFDADRFGLSQLHQLRGRVGRGQFQGYCFLMTGNESDEAIQRLNVMEQTSDGFEIAEADFAIRGPGDVLGTRQHGRLPLRSADLIRDAEVLSDARELAIELVNDGSLDRTDFQSLKNLVLDRFSELMDLHRTG